MNNEVWKQIENYPDYFVSNTGKVRNIKTGREKTQELMSNGYLRVCLFKKQRGKHFLVHRLVATAFIPNPDNLDTVDHINGIETDNRIENLRWLSRSDNLNRFWKEQITEEQLKKITDNAKKASVKAHESQTWRKSLSVTHEKHKKPIICTDTGVIYDSAKSASNTLGISPPSINKVLKGLSKTTHGLHFEYL